MRIGFSQHPIRMTGECDQLIMEPVLAGRGGGRRVNCRRVLCVFWVQFRCEFRPKIQTWIAPEPVNTWAPGPGHEPATAHMWTRPIAWQGCPYFVAFLLFGAALHKNQLNKKKKTDGSGASWTPVSCCSTAVWKAIHPSMLSRGQ